MLSKILSVTGRPGLYKLVSTNKNLNIIESLSDGKRIPVYAQEKVIALSDVSIYTDEGDTPLREVFKTIREKEDGKKVSLGSKPSGNELFTYLKEVLPNYSKESVYASDVKKIIAWYNLLMEYGIDLEEEEVKEEEVKEEEIKEEEIKEDEIKDNDTGDASEDKAENATKKTQGNKETQGDKKTQGDKETKGDKTPKEEATKKA